MPAAPNALAPDLMSADERLAEIVDILAAGLMRLPARKSTPLSRDSGESSLASWPGQRRHADDDQVGKAS
jgi:hypothetical protein